MNTMKLKTVGATLEEDMLGAVHGGGGKHRKPPSGFWKGVSKVGSVIGKVGKVAGRALAPVAIVSAFIEGFSEGPKR